MEKKTDVGERRAAYRAPGVTVILTRDTQAGPGNASDDPPSSPPTFSLRS